MEHITREQAERLVLRDLDIEALGADVALVWATIESLRKAGRPDSDLMRRTIDV
jgi:hypothetical protein